MVDEEKEQTIKDKIIELLDKSYKRSQLINDFGLAPSTVDTVIREYKGRHGGKLPAERSPAANGGKFEVMKMDTKQIIPPEQALVGIRLQDGEYKLGFQDGMSVLLMAARYNQILAASQSEILTNQIKIMEESRKGSMDMANEAAMKAAAATGAQIMPRLDQLANQMTAGSQNPMASMMTTLMMPSMQQAAQKLAGLFTKTQPGAQPGATGQAETGGGQEPPQQAAPNIEDHDISEWEE